MKLNYWNTSCVTYLMGMFVGLAMANLSFFWSLIPILGGGFVLGFYHYIFLEEKMEKLK